VNRRRAFVVIVMMVSAAIFLADECRVGAFQGEPDGYGGISWGTPLESVASMEYIGKQKDAPAILLYRRAGDNLFYGKARLKSIDYGFEGGLLTTVTLRVNSLLQYLLMKEEAFSRFGKGKDVDPFSERFAWEGERTTRMLVSAFDMS